MEDLYIYKIIEKYFFNKKEKIPGVVLSLLKNIEPYLKDVSDFLEELQLECPIVMPDGNISQFEFERIINNYKITFRLDCDLEQEFWFTIEDINNNNNYIFPEYRRWLPVKSIDSMRKQLSDWTDL